MSARSFHSTNVAAGRHGKYQLDVTACDVADVVLHAGGWLFDRAMAGWDIRVQLAEAGDPTPLRILGVRADRTDEPDDPTAPPRVHALAASLDAAVGTSEVRAGIARALQRGLAEVTLWGGRPGQHGSARLPQLGVEGIERNVTSVDHVLSAAARAFKTQALRAAGLTDPVAPIETFQRRATAPASD